MEENMTNGVPVAEELNARLAAAETENRLYRMGPEMGVSPAAVPYLAKLCPAAEMEEDALREAIETILRDLPGLRTTQSNAEKTAFRIGAGAVPAQNDDALLRAAFGL